MGKKKKEYMALERERFLAGVKQRGTAEVRLAGEIFDQMETFAAYGFNKSHSAAYALITYQTAYLKAHYPTEFMAGLLSLEAGDADSTYKNIAECRERAIPVLPPDVNASREDFTAAGGTIRFGLAAVKGVGSKAIEAIIAAREAIGFFITGHPLDRYENDLRKFTNATTGTLRTRGRDLPAGDGQRNGRPDTRPRVKVGGVIHTLKLKNSKKGDRYATFALEDKEGVVDVIAWPDAYRKHEDVIQGGAPVVVS